MTALTARMRELALTHEQGDELLDVADQLDDAVESMKDDRESIRRVVGCWARARLLWFACTGESFADPGVVQGLIQKLQHP